MKTYNYSETTMDTEGTPDCCLNIRPDLIHINDQHVKDGDTIKCEVCGRVYTLGMTLGKIPSLMWRRAR